MPRPAEAANGHFSWHELIAGQWEAAFRFYSQLFGWQKTAAMDMGPMGTYLALYGALRVLLDPLRGDGRPERFLGISHHQGIALCAIALALVWQRTTGTTRATIRAS